MYSPFRLVLIGASLVLSTTTVFADASAHPLDPLSADEIMIDPANVPSVVWQNHWASVTFLLD